MSCSYCMDVIKDRKVQQQEDHKYNHVIRSLILGGKISRTFHNVQANSDRSSNLRNFNVFSRLYSRRIIFIEHSGIGFQQQLQHAYMIKNNSYLMITL